MRLVNKLVPKTATGRAGPGNAAKIAGNAPFGVQARKKLAREALPKGPLETVADLNRLLDRA